MPLESHGCKRRGWSCESPPGCSGGGGGARTSGEAEGSFVGGSLGGEGGGIGARHSAPPRPAARSQWEGRTSDAETQSGPRSQQQGRDQAGLPRWPGKGVGVTCESGAQ